MDNGTIAGVCGVSGFGAVMVGLWLVSPSVALVIGGVSLLWIAYRLVNWRERAR